MSPPPAQVKIGLALRDNWGNEIQFQNEAIIGRKDQTNQQTVAIDLSSYPNGKSVSRTHARVFQQNGNWCIEDLGSTNGTYVGGKKITQPEELSDKQTVSFGGVVFIVSFFNY